MWVLQPLEETYMDGIEISTEISRWNKWVLDRTLDILKALSVFPLSRLVRRGGGGVQ
jgi:hypothetical protein